ncbi:MAG: hypothetical protein RML40_11875, partial [Bacteroidota bacterium]|nr:hypothetical protein [Bacteroidota bacterium]
MSTTTTENNAGEQADLRNMLFFVGVGLVVMFAIIFAGLYAEAYINPWIKGKPERYGQTALTTPYPRVVEPNPRPTNPLDEVLTTKLPAPPDDPRLPVRNGLILWLRADAVPQGTKAGDLVAILPDASPLRNDARQVYPVSRPRYAPQEINGVDALHFD